MSGFTARPSAAVAGDAEPAGEERMGPDPMPTSGPRLALVLWNGDVGGAEVLNAKLAERLRRLGAGVTIVFVGSPEPLAERLGRAGIPYRSLGLGRGRNVLLHPRLYASEVMRAGGDGALLIERGFVAAALRAGGYRAPIVAVEHGSLLFEREPRFRPRWLLRRASRVIGARAADAETAVSDFMLERMCEQPHAVVARRIYNGVDPDFYHPAQAERTQSGGELVVGFAGRLVPGKGADHLINAIDRAGPDSGVRLVIAGDGAERDALAAQARRLKLGSRAEFLGTISDMPAFWRECDIAAIPSDTWIESFSMVTLEAMSCGKAIVASRDGAIPELIIDGVSGTLVRPGDVGALAAALAAYAADPALRERHGSAARERAVESFHIERCARSYLDLFAELAVRRGTTTG